MVLYTIVYVPNVLFLLVGLTSRVDALIKTRVGWRSWCALVDPVAGERRERIAIPADQEKLKYIHIFFFLNDRY